jgi:hypothetical protein
MKRIGIYSIVLFFVAFLPLKTIANGIGDSTGLPGDNLDLRAVLDLFKHSSNPEDFEKKLNTRENHVNNLDLDGDHEVDYIRVIDMNKGDIHCIVLQDPINAKESQDVAVIELELKGDKNAQLEIVGDEELYGEKYIIKPGETTKTDSLDAKWRGFSYSTVVVNVWAWPCVQYVYYPGYIIYVSPWYWMYWPYWWSPWTPYPYGIYYGYVYYYQEYYFVDDDYDMIIANTYYGPRRVASSSVHEKYKVAHEDYKQQKKNKNVVQPPKPANPNDVAKPEPTPASKGNADPNPQPKGNATPIPDPQPKSNPNPVPVPQPKPQVNPQPIPNPQPRGDVHPQPTPRPNPQPTPQPPRGKPRFWRKNN